MSGEHRVLCDQSKIVCNGKPAGPPKAFVYTVWEVEHQDVVSAGIIAEQYLDNRF
jgi:hypothetical protein